MNRRHSCCCTNVRILDISERARKRSYLCNDSFELEYLSMFGLMICTKSTSVPEEEECKESSKSRINSDIYGLSNKCGRLEKVNTYMCMEMQAPSLIDINLKLSNKNWTSNVGNRAEEAYVGLNSAEWPFDTFKAQWKRFPLQVTALDCGTKG